MSSITDHCFFFFIFVASWSQKSITVGANRQYSGLQYRPRVEQTTLCWQSGKQAGTHFLLLPPSLWSHLLCRIAVRFTRNCYQRWAPKNDHMPRAADLCFLCLRVSQNAALYRNAETRASAKPVQGLRALSSVCTLRFFLINCIFYCFYRLKCPLKGRLITKRAFRFESI